MKKKLQALGHRSRKSLALAAAAIAVGASAAMALPPIDFTGVSTGVVDQAQEGITSGVPIFALMLALTVGLKALRKITH